MASLSLLPSFPPLRQHMPMDVAEEGFRHIGLCCNLVKLWCMYCRDTSDRATEHLAALRKLKFYYSGMTRITDRSLEILAGVDSLEELEFWHCNSITTAGVSLDGLQNVSREIVSRFPELVRMSYSG